jgi:hypothetical protein
MLRIKSILLLLILAFVVQDTSAACAVVDRFIGSDSEDAIILTFTYDLTIASSVKSDRINAALAIILPDIEEALAEQCAPVLIPACAPAGTNTTSFADIEGLHLDPKDKVVGNCTLPDKPNCYTIRSRTTVYVKSTANKVPGFFFYAMGTTLPTLKTGTFSDLAIEKLDNFKTVQATTGPPSPSAPQTTGSRTLAPSSLPTPGPRRTRSPAPESTGTDEPTLSPTEGTILQKAKAFHEDNQAASWGIMGGIFLILVIITVVICVCCCRLRKG